MAGARGRTEIDETAKMNGEKGLNVKRNGTSRTRRIARAMLRAVGPAALVFGLTACYRHDDMSIQPKYYHAYRPSSFFADGMSERPLEQGVVPHGMARTDLEFYFGRDQNDPTKFIDHFPPGFPTSGPELEKHILRGQQRFNIYCIVCHGQLGFGDGMVVKRGFPSPPSYHYARLMQHEPLGHYFDVITNGWGAMFGYAERVSPEDRWNIIAYIKVLQLSENATPEVIDAAEAMHTPDEIKAATANRPVDLPPGGAQ